MGPRSRLPHPHWAAAKTSFDGVVGALLKWEQGAEPKKKNNRHGSDIKKTTIRKRYRIIAKLARNIQFIRPVHPLFLSVPFSCPNPNAYLCVCVCLCARQHVCVCVCMCDWVCVCVACTCVQRCSVRTRGCETRLICSCLVCVFSCLGGVCKPISWFLFYVVVSWWWIWWL